MESLTCLFLLLYQYMTRSLLTFSQCVMMPLNGFRKHSKCMNPNHRWYVMLTFCVWMWVTCTTKTWTWLTSVINFIMCTKFTTGCVGTSVGGIFSFGAMASSFSICALIYKTLFKEVKVKPMVHYNFWNIFFLAKIKPTNFGARDHLVLVIQRLGIRKKYRFTPTKTVSVWI